VKVKSVVTDSPCNGTFFAGGRSLVCLTFDAEIHDVISADGAIVDDDIPSPKSHSRPLLDLKPLLAICPSFSSSAFRLASNLLGDN